MKQISKKLVVLCSAIAMLIGFQPQVFAQEVKDAKMIELIPEASRTGRLYTDDKEITVLPGQTVYFINKYTNQPLFLVAGTIYSYGITFKDSSLFKFFEYGLIDLNSNIIRSHRANGPISTVMSGGTVVPATGSYIIYFRNLNLEPVTIRELFIRIDV